MKTTDIHLVYFSATYTTRKIVREIARVMGGNVVEHDITCGGPDAGVSVAADGGVLVVGVPVYAGRVPAQAAEALKAFHGNATPAVIVCVYGNRDYDDALVELYDIALAQGFRPFAAGTFIARHCIFPKVAADRPDAADMLKVDDFARKCAGLLAGGGEVPLLPPFGFKGNRPYKKPGAVPLHPSGDKKLCDGCLTCVKLCPVGAISADAPCKTDGSRCISCGRCTVVCPRHARAFGGMIYKIAGMKFVKDNAARREPETFFPPQQG